MSKEVLSQEELALSKFFGLEIPEDFIPEGFMQCIRCKEVKPFTAFEVYPLNTSGYRYTCRDCRIIEHREYYQRNKESIEHKRIYHRVLKPRESWVYSTIAGHKKRGCKILFDRKELIKLAYNTDKCSICSIVLNWNVWGKGGFQHDNSPSLDRVNCDNTLTINNIQIVCSLCNRSKNSRTMQEFINYCALIVLRFTKEIEYENEIFERR